MRIAVIHDVDSEELWSEVFGAGWESCSWWRFVEYHDGADWDKPGRVTIGIENPDGEGTVTRDVDPESFAAAITKVVKEGWRDACTGERISLDIEFEWDACSSDVVLQMAVLGEVVYG